MLDLKIINGKLIDTEKEQLLPLQLGIKDGKIACIGEDLPDAVRVIPGGRGHSPGSSVNTCGTIGYAIFMQGSARSRACRRSACGRYLRRP